MAEDSDMTPNTEKAGEEVEGITESASMKPLRMKTEDERNIHVRGQRTDHCPQTSLISTRRPVGNERCSTFTLHF